MKKVLIIVGPTGVGKTSLSIKLAKKFNAEIISGDSVQVYKGLDIGSAKISEDEKEGVKHYGIDTLSCFDNYSVADFQFFARNKINEITDKDKLPLIVGGTGLYIKACIYDYVFAKQNETDAALISHFNKMSNEELYEQLLKTDFKAGEKIHPNNRKRIIRALIINSNSFIKKSELEAMQKHELLYDVFIVGCTMDREILYKKINDRVDLMFDYGLKEEIENLLSQGLTFNHQSMQAIGYKEWRDYFNNEITIEDVKSLIKKHTRQFAKRQYTWFKNQMQVNWIDMNNNDETKQIIRKIEDWYG